MGSLEIQRSRSWRTSNDFEMPEGAELLHFAKQGDNLCVWARVKRSIGCDVPKRTRRLYLVG